MNTSNLKQPLLAITSASVLAGVLLLAFALFYGDWTQFFKDTDSEFKSSLPYIYVAIIGIAVTVATIVATVLASQRNRLKQDTIKILFESRLSDYYQSLLEKTKEHFPVGETACPDKFENLMNSKKPEDVVAADAAIQILNYHEFIAAGIREGNLDEGMLKKTIRRILCCLVFEMRDVIMYFRRDQGEKCFEHLISIYWQWVEKGKHGEHDSSMGEDDDYFDPLKPKQGRSKGLNSNKKKSKPGVRAKSRKR